ncbi:unnamed protein product, partial [Brassica rapa subsp. trilocularis]
KIDTPLNERNARLLMMVLLLHHKGAAKIGLFSTLIVLCTIQSKKISQPLLGDQIRDQELTVQKQMNV